MKKLILILTVLCMSAMTGCSLMDNTTAPVVEATSAATAEPEAQATEAPLAETDTPADEPAAEADNG